MEIKNRKIGYGLLELPKDERDFSHTRTFGSLAVEELPLSDFLVSVPLEMKNQDINYFSDFCTSYAAAEVAENEDQVIFCPEWTFAYAKNILALKYGTEVLATLGLNLRDICNAALQSNGGGFLPRSQDPFKCDTAARPNRDFLAVLGNWPTYTDLAAQKYAKIAYYSVDGPHDTFDNFRATMWKNLPERRSIIVGCLWRESWSEAPGGIVPKTYEPDGSAHAFCIIGQKTINLEIYLVARLSDGVNFGDNGLFYFPREVVNAELSTYGAYTFKDVAPIIPSSSTGVSFNILNIFNPLWIYKVIRNLFPSNA